MVSRPYACENDPAVTPCRPGSCLPWYSRSSDTARWILPPFWNSSGRSRCWGRRGLHRYQLVPGGRSGVRTGGEMVDERFELPEGLPASNPFARYRVRSGGGAGHAVATS